jgi:cyclic pyranopterin phosphate synthase
MIDITRKYFSLRTAKAVAYLKVSPLSIEAIKNKTVPKGDVFECSKVAGIMGVKNTHHALPHCHPIPVEFTSVNHRILNDQEIEIEVVVKTIYKTGCEMEALHGASVAALSIYDMLKPIDKDIEIHSIKLLEKTGGKSGLQKDVNGLKAAVLIISDSVSNKTSEDTSGKWIAERLEEIGFKPIHTEVVPDEIEQISEALKKLIADKTDLIISTGGTGISPRDHTFEAVQPLIQEEIPGLMEAARAYSQNLTPFAMLSRGIAGFSQDSLIITLPGSLNACKEYVGFLFPNILHAYKVRRGERHE